MILENIYSNLMSFMINFKVLPDLHWFWKASILIICLQGIKSLLGKIVIELTKPKNKNVIDVIYIIIGLYPEKFMGYIVFLMIGIYIGGLDFIVAIVVVIIFYYNLYRILYIIDWIKKK